MTSDLKYRVWQHKTKVFDGFTAKYNVDILVHMEEFSHWDEALHRERSVKKWNRQWKLRLIEENNPDWIDYYETIM